EYEVGGGGNRKCDGVEQEWRTGAIERAGNDQDWAGDPRELGRKVHAGEHAVDRAIADRVTTQPPGAEGRKALCVVAQLRRIAEIERIDDSLQPLAFHLLYAGQQCGAPIGSNADGWAANDRRCDALRTSCRGVQGDGAADGNTG